MNKLYLSPLKKAYWKAAANELKDVRKLTLCALLIALQIVISSFYFTVGENLRIYFSFFVAAINSCLIGPVMALVAGFILDNLSFIIHPSGAYFFGYVLSTMAGMLIYALFFWRSRITVVKLIAAKLLVNLLVNVLMGSLWSSMIYTRGFWFYVSASLIKNIAMLPIEVICLFLVFKAILPFLYRRRLVLCKTVTFF